MDKKFSIVIPVYGNEKNLPVTIPYIVEHLNLFPNYDIELILVCDGSPDNSYQVMEQYRRQYPELIRTVKFTRNFGQGAAIRCGVTMASGDVIGIISADMQDPFELFVEMLQYWEQGYKLVIGTRRERPEHGLARLTSKLTHRLIHNLINHDYPTGGFDFWIMDRKAAETYLAVSLPNGSMQLAVLWAGYKYKLIEYDRQERKIGKSGYGWTKKIHILSGIFTTYSRLPLRILLIPAIGSGFTTIAFIVASVVAIIQKKYLLTGFCIQLLLMSLFAAIFLGAMIIFGEYVWRIFSLVQDLPRYIVDDETTEKNTQKEIKELVLYGAGGMGAEISFLVEQINRVQPTYHLLGFVVDSEYYRENVFINGYPLLGDAKWLLEHKDEVVCTCAIGNPAARHKVQESMEVQGVRFETLIHPTAAINPSSAIGAGSVIGRSCGVSDNVQIGKGCFMNGPVVSVGHDVKIGNYTILMPKVQISGHCRIGNEVMVGGCSFINPHIKVEDKAVIAPGSVVFGRVKAETHVLGNPAHKIDL